MTTGFEIVRAFENHQKGNSGNYATDGKALTLFNNRIAEYRDGVIYFTLAGWNSNTTKKALNWLTGVHIQTKRGTLTNNGHEINSNDWYPVVPLTCEAVQG